MTYKEGKTSSKSSEWYTPSKIIQPIKDFMGVIDLDPCAEPARAVPALRHFVGSEIDGLAQPWYGRVFMNPPYGKAIPPWIHKALTEPLDEIIMLVPASVETRWFDPLFDACALCFLRSRVKFSGCKDAAFVPSVLAYRGPREAAFIQHFSPMGKAGKFS